MNIYFPWLKTWLIGVWLLLAALIFNETTLRLAGHQPSLVSDADLFCQSYTRVADMEQDDVLLLGASRIQTNFDLDTFERLFPERQILQLAQSGRGTAFPVFEDIVNNSMFNGTIIISETEQTLASWQRDQEGFVQYCHNNFSIDRRLNRQITTWLQSRFVFINPQSSSFRLWGNLLIQQELPEPLYIKMQDDRSLLSDFQRANPEALQSLYLRRIEGTKRSTSNTQNHPSSTEWLAQTNHWPLLIQRFQMRGGRVIFVRMPVSMERWEIMRQAVPPEEFWNLFVNRSNVASVHFAHHPILSQFNFPDASHLDKRDRTVFTKQLLRQLDVFLTSKPIVTD